LSTIAVRCPLVPRQSARKLADSDFDSRHAEVRIPNNALNFRLRPSSEFATSFLRVSSLATARNLAKRFFASLEALDPLSPLMMVERRLAAKLDAVRHGAGAPFARAGADNSRSNSASPPKDDER
jgi:hypothetical protein